MNRNNSLVTRVATASKSMFGRAVAGVSAMGASAMAFAGGSSVAQTIGSAANTEFTAAQTLIIGLLTTLVLIAIGFVVYSLIKKAR